MSIYIKEKTEYVEECFQSLLHQTVLADEWVIVEDGQLTKEMYDLLTHYEKAYPNLIKRVPLKENQGLGLALRAGIVACSNELVARMDTDDIARKDRFEKQLSVFQHDPTVDVCLSSVYCENNIHKYLKVTCFSYKTYLIYAILSLVSL